MSGSLFFINSGSGTGCGCCTSTPPQRTGPTCNLYWTMQFSGVTPISGTITNEYGVTMEWVDSSVLNSQIFDSSGSPPLVENYGNPYWGGVVNEGGGVLVTPTISSAFNSTNTLMTLYVNVSGGQFPFFQMETNGANPPQITAATQNNLLAPATGNCASGGSFTIQQSAVMTTNCGTCVIIEPTTVTTQYGSTSIGSTTPYALQGDTSSCGVGLCYIDVPIGGGTLLWGTGNITYRGDIFMLLINVSGAPPIYYSSPTLFGTYTTPFPNVTPATITVSQTVSLAEPLAPLTIPKPNCKNCSRAKRND